MRLIVRAIKLQLDLLCLPSMLSNNTTTFLTIVVLQSLVGIVPCGVMGHYTLKCPGSTQWQHIHIHRGVLILGGGKTVS